MVRVLLDKTEDLDTIVGLRTRTSGTQKITITRRDPLITSLSVSCVHANSTNKRSVNTGTESTVKYMRCGQ